MTNYQINDLLEGDEVPIDPRRIPPWRAKDKRPDARVKNKLTSLRTINTPQSEIYFCHQRMSLFKLLADYLTLSFKIDGADPLAAFGESKGESDIVDAVTEADFVPISRRLKYFYTFIDNAMLITLLCGRLNDAETYGLRFWVATTLVYERLVSSMEVIRSLADLLKYACFLGCLSGLSLIRGREVNAHKLR